MEEAVMFKPEWEPNALQLKAYLGREVSMCVEAMRRNRHLLQGHTLFSVNTWAAAYTQAQREGVR